MLGKNTHTEALLEDSSEVDLEVNTKKNIKMLDKITIY
jgi:hypothetical protein